ncbi:hypothetical protein LTS03_011846, partial [Exophiala xenobiotica]
YKPPECWEAEASATKVDIRLCDLWTLGIACWEVLQNGKPYYDTPAKPQSSGGTNTLDWSSPTLRDEDLTNTDRAATDDINP